ncbi:carbon-nitrogen hydrolase family protein [Olivibacter sp. XZL3]|uniref:carbon-nitrogen hydrolase family protein n=1 Tax=Olivibacter sp. XZL3 TaxID=1735116 RepID=UPI00106599A4|nr:carbon-nitrogen hydrolase family protein [Olivibacter sp. XZL3]
MKIALASPPFPGSISHGLKILQSFSADAVAQGAEIVCFPESFLPGYPGMGYPIDDRSPLSLQKALNSAVTIAKTNNIAIILPMDGCIDDQLYNLAYVIDKSGKILGYQTKNQLDPSEDDIWTAGEKRQVFEVNGVKFGITICHEGFRYPESVRWCAVNDAKIVFHPHFSGSNDQGPILKRFGAIENPYYERAMMMRALENTIYFASVNYASNYPESASAMIAPDGSCIAHQGYGEAGVLVVDLDLDKATGLLAKRFKSHLFL